MKNLLFLISILLLTVSCEMRVENSKSSVNVSSEEDKLSERVSYVNEPIDLFSSASKSASINTKSASVGEVAITLTSPMTVTDDYTQVISGNYSQALTVNKGDVICVAEDAVFTGTLNMNGGILAVFGKVDMGWNWFLGGSGTVMVSSGASFYVNYFENTSGIKLVNYGSLSFSEWSGLNIAGQFENYSNLVVNSISLKVGGKLYNSGKITINNSFIVEGIFENEGKIDVKSNLYLNANGEFENYCSVTVKETMTVDGTLVNYSYVKVSGDLYINPNNGVELKGNSLISVKNVTLDSDIRNNDEALAVIYATGEITHNKGNVDDMVLITNLDDECYVPGDDCSPGYGNVPVFSLVAEVASPSIDGEKLSATSVQVIDNMAYVTYHLNGEEYGGAIEVIELDQLGVPKIKQQLSSSDYDFNELKLADNETFGNQRKMWVVGAQRLSSSETIKTPAIMAEFTLADKLIKEESIDAVVDIDGYSGNSVQSLDDVVLVTSGSNGGISVIDNGSSSVSSFTSLEFMKYLVVSDEYIISLTASITGAQLQSYSVASSDLSTPERVADLGQIDPYDGKLVLTVDDEEIYVACGTSGLKIYDTETLEEIADYETVDGITNGVVTDDDFVYLANGSGGLEIVKKHSLTKLGVYDFDGSANYVAVQDGYIFIVNGTGGLKILYRSL